MASQMADATLDFVRERPLAFGLTAGVGVVYLTYKWMRGSSSSPPTYVDSNTWFVRESDGSGKADVFYAHPTTHVGLLRANMAWEDIGKCTGPVAGSPDLLVISYFVGVRTVDTNRIYHC